jgi:Class II flagellar assembly regulator
MRVYGPNGAMVTGPARETRRGDGPAFVLPQSSENARPQGATTLRPISSVDALLAVQAVDDGAERRRKQVRRGRATLSALDDLKVALLSGRIDRTLLARLKAESDGLSMATGDARLDAITAEIELRAAVELAKLDGNSPRSAA